MSDSSLKIPVTLTALAIEKVNKALKARGKGLGIRLSLVKGGCAGWSYAMQYVDEIEPGDLKFTFCEFDLFIHKKLYPYLKGVTLDYHMNDLEEGFTFIHPEFNERCYCGKSFSCSPNL